MYEYENTGLCNINQCYLLFMPGLVSKDSGLKPQVQYPVNAKSNLIYYVQTHKPRYLWYVW